MMEFIGLYGYPSEWVQLIFAAIGVVITTWWVVSCVGNLRALYRSGYGDTVMEMQAWEKIGVGMILCAMQFMWLASGLGSFSVATTTHEGRMFEYAMAARGALGSFMLVMVVLFKRWSWRRILALDRNQLPMVTRFDALEAQMAADAELIRQEARALVVQINTGATATATALDETNHINLKITDLNQALRAQGLQIMRLSGEATRLESIQTTGEESNVILKETFRASPSHGGKPTDDDGA